MRIAMTSEMQDLWKEIEPYYDDTFHLVADAPDEIKQKDILFNALYDKEAEEAELLNMM